MVSVEQANSYRPWPTSLRPRLAKQWHRPGSVARPSGAETDLRQSVAGPAGSLGTRPCRERCSSTRPAWVCDTPASRASPRTVKAVSAPARTRKTLDTVGASTTVPGAARSTAPPPSRATWHHFSAMWRYYSATPEGWELFACSPENTRQLFASATRTGTVRCTKWAVLARRDGLH